MTTTISPLESLTDTELEFLASNIDKFSEEEAAELEMVADELEKRAWS